MPVSTCSAELAAQSRALTLRVVDEMYCDPFWMERFGDRGRRFAEQDGQHHLTYLIQALDSASPVTMTNYATWLQSVLTTRGMCTRHLAENFERLALAIEQSAIPDVEPALAYLQAAIAALVYPAGPAREVQLLADRLAVAAFERLSLACGPVYDRCLDDLHALVSYLSDALALEQTRVLSEYVTWWAESLGKRGVPEHVTAAMFDAVHEELEQLPADARVNTERVLDAGRASLVDDAS